MNLHSVSIGTLTFALSPGVRLAKLQRRVTKLAKRGGGVIEIPTRGPDTISMLVSPGVSVLFHTRHVSAEDISVARTDDTLSVHHEDFHLDFL